MPHTYIIGHQKPDTDAVVAAMALEYLFSQRECFGYSQAEARITDPLNPETTYLFERFKTQAPALITAADIQPEDQVVLVDHNETAQRLADLAESQVVEIVDHHQVHLNLNRPIFLNFKPWGSSTTIVYYLMKQQGVAPEPQLAALMLATILSDTVGYKSATTTDKDTKFGQELAELAQINDIQGFAADIFRAKSNLGDLSDEEIVKNDYKIYEFAQKTFISQLETVEQAELIDNKDRLIAAMVKIKEELGVELLFVAVTDVLAVNTKLLLAGEKEMLVAEKAFGGSAQDYVLDIGPKLSRKKEIALAIEEVLAHA